MGGAGAGAAVLPAPAAASPPSAAAAPGTAGIQDDCCRDRKSWITSRLACPDSVAARSSEESSSSCGRGRRGELSPRDAPCLLHALFLNAPAPTLRVFLEAVAGPSFARRTKCLTLSSPRASMSAIMAVALLTMPMWALSASPLASPAAPAARRAAASWRTHSGTCGGARAGERVLGTGADPRPTTLAKNKTRNRMAQRTASPFLEKKAAPQSHPPSPPRPPGWTAGRSPGPPC